MRIAKFDIQIIKTKVDSRTKEIASNYYPTSVF